MYYYIFTFITVNFLLQVTLALQLYNNLSVIVIENGFVNLKSDSLKQSLCSVLHGVYKFFPEMIANGDKHKNNDFILYLALLKELLQGNGKFAKGILTFLSVKNILASNGEEWTRLIFTALSFSQQLSIICTKVGNVD